MPEAQIRQRLAAILAADAVGYSRLMAADERATLAALDAARAVFREQIETRQGRIVDTAGDSVLAVFETASGAVDAALAIQDALRDSTSGEAEARRMRFRIGVHLGDVIEKPDATIYGDGVNVAARLQQLADPGGVAVSEAVEAAVRHRVAAAFEDRGAHPVKNLPHPVRAFAWRASATTKPPQADPAATSVEGKPSVAVLAFVNMSGDPSQEYFCDGICEDIITDLSKISGMAVVNRQSSFAYKGKQLDLRQIASELGVRYVLEGSARTSGGRLRLNAQLIEAEAGTHVWANRYDRDAGDAFLIGDEIAEDIVAALDVKLARGEEARVWRKTVRTPAAREAFFRGQEAYFKASPENLRRAREHFFEAMRLEPGSGAPFSSAAVTHIVEVIFGWSDDPRASLAEAERLARQAMERDDSLSGAHYVRGIAALYHGRHDEALAAGQRGLEVRPMCSGPRAGLAYLELYLGEFAPAIKHAQEAIAFNPVYPGWFLYLNAAAEYFGGQAERALATLERALAASPGLLLAKALRVAVLHDLGRKDQAHAAAREVLASEPDLTPERLASTQPFKDAAQRERYLGVLGAAGLFGG